MRGPAVVVSENYQPAYLRSLSTIYTATTVDANVVGTTETILASCTVPANFLTVGSILRFNGFGTLTRSAGGPTITLKLRWGGIAGTQIATSSAGIAATVTNQMVNWTVELATVTVGAAGTVWGSGLAAGFVVSSVSYSPLAIGTGTAAGTAQTATATVDTTVSTVFCLTARWSAGTAGNTISVDSGAFVRVIA